MIKRQKKQKGGRSKLKTGLAIAGGALLAGGIGYIAGKARSKATGGGGKSRKKSAGWYARQIARLKLKKRYDKLRLSV